MRTLYLAPDQVQIPATSDSTRSSMSTSALAATEITKTCSRHTAQYLKDSGYLTHIAHTEALNESSNPEIDFDEQVNDPTLKDSPSRHLVTEDSDEEGPVEVDFPEADSERTGEIIRDEDNWDLEQALKKDTEEDQRIHLHFTNIEEASEELKEMLFEHGFPHTKSKAIESINAKKKEDLSTIFGDNTAQRTNVSKDSNQINTSNNSGANMRGRRRSLPERVATPIKRVSGETHSAQTTPRSGRKRSIDNSASEQNKTSPKHRKLSIVQSDAEIEKTRSHLRSTMTNLIVEKSGNPQATDGEIASEIDETLWKENNGWGDNYRKRMRDVLGHLQLSSSVCSRLRTKELAVSDFLKMGYNELADEKLKAERDEARKEDMYEHILPAKSEVMQFVMVPSARQEPEICEITAEGIHRSEGENPASIREQFHETEVSTS